ADLPGQSLMSIAGAPDEPPTAVFSEYHGPMSAAASFMIRRGDWKYVRYMLEDTPAQLFDMAADPDELDDRINDPAMAGLTIELEAELVAILDPDATDQRVRAEQQANLAAVERPPRAGGAELPRTALGTIALGWSVPPPEIMAVVDPQTRAT
ncbi:MAG: hypothetical protein GY708_25040, partial [Actinomycetia bacterium]|nr:hypothetical protein [Actinomycetes bacterium]